MKMLPVVLTLASLLANSAAQAAVHNSANAYYRGGYFIPFDGFDKTEVDQTHTSGGSDWASASATTQNDAKAGVVGITADAQSRANQNRLEAAHSLRWVPPSDTINVGASAYTSDIKDAPQSGRIRFFIDYELSASGPNTQTMLNFNAESLLLDPQAEYDVTPAYASFSKRVTSGTEKGSWQSEWLSFSTASDLKEIHPTWNSYRYSLSVLTSSFFHNFDNPYQDAWGSANGLGTATLRFEIAPIPEPETYALMAAGLGVVALAKRRRKAGKC